MANFKFKITTELDDSKFKSQLKSMLQSLNDIREIKVGGLDNSVFTQVETIKKLIADYNKIMETAEGKQLVSSSKLTMMDGLKEKFQTLMEVLIKTNSELAEFGNLFGTLEEKQPALQQMKTELMDGGTALTSAPTAAKKPAQTGFSMKIIDATQTKSAEEVAELQRQIVERDKQEAQARAEFIKELNENRKQAAEQIKTAAELPPALAELNKVTAELDESKLTADINEAARFKAVVDKYNKVIAEAKAVEDEVKTYMAERTKNMFENPDAVQPKVPQHIEKSLEHIKNYVLKNFNDIQSGIDLAQHTGHIEKTLNSVKLSYEALAPAKESAIKQADLEATLYKKQQEEMEAIGEAYLKMADAAELYRQAAASSGDVKMNKILLTLEKQMLAYETNIDKMHSANSAYNETAPLAEAAHSEVNKLEKMQVYARPEDYNRLLEKAEIKEAALAEKMDALDSKYRASTDAIALKRKEAMLTMQQMIAELDKGEEKARASVGTAVASSEKVATTVQQMKAALAEAGGQATESVADALTSAGNAAGTASLSVAGFVEKLAQIGLAVNAVETLAKSFAALNQPAKAMENSLAALEAAGVRNAGQLKGSVTEVSKEHGTSSAKLMESAGQIVASGLAGAADGNVDVERVRVLLESISMLSIATGADLQTVTKEATELISAFDVPTSGVSSMFDKISYAAKNTNMDTKLLIDQLGKVGVVAKSSGVGLDEITATLMVMQRNGRDAAQTATAIQSMLGSLQNPDKVYEAKLTQVMSTAGVDAMTMKSEGMLATLSRIRAAQLELGIESKELFRGQANFALFEGITDNIADVKAELASLSTTAAGSMEASFGAMQSTTEAQTQGIMNSLELLVQDAYGAVNELSGGFLMLSTDIGAQLLPQLAGVAGNFNAIREAGGGLFGEGGVFGKAAGRFKAVWSESKKLSESFGNMQKSAGHVGAVSSSVQALGGAFGKLSTGVKAFGKGLYAALGPVGLVSAGIMGLVALGNLLYDNFRPFRDLVQSIGAAFFGMQTDAQNAHDTIKRLQKSADDRQLERNKVGGIDDQLSELSKRIPEFEARKNKLLQELSKEQQKTVKWEDLIKENSQNPEFKLVHQFLEAVKNAKHTNDKAKDLDNDTKELEKWVSEIGTKTEKEKEDTARALIKNFKAYEYSDLKDKLDGVLREAKTSISFTGKANLTFNEKTLNEGVTKILGESDKAAQAQEKTIKHLNEANGLLGRTSQNAAQATKQAAKPVRELQAIMLSFAEETARASQALESLKMDRLAEGYSKFGQELYKLDKQHRATLNGIQKQIADAEKKLADAKQKWDDGKNKWTEGEYKQAKNELDDLKKVLQDTQAEQEVAVAAARVKAQENRLAELQDNAKRVALEQAQSVADFAKSMFQVKYDWLEQFDFGFIEARYEKQLAQIKMKFEETKLTLQKQGKELAEEAERANKELEELKKEQEEDRAPAVTKEVNGETVALTAEELAAEVKRWEEHNKALLGSRKQLEEKITAINAQVAAIPEQEKSADREKEVADRMAEFDKEKQAELVSLLNSSKSYAEFEEQKTELLKKHTEQRRRMNLEAQLDAGNINQATYDAQIAVLDQEEKLKAEDTKFSAGKLADKIFGTKEEVASKAQQVITAFSDISKAHRQAVKEAKKMYQEDTKAALTNYLQRKTDGKGYYEEMEAATRKHNEAIKAADEERSRAQKQMMLDGITNSILALMPELAISIAKMTMSETASKGPLGLITAGIAAAALTALVLGLKSQAESWLGLWRGGLVDDYLQSGGLVRQGSGRYGVDDVHVVVARDEFIEPVAATKNNLAELRWIQRTSKNISEMYLQPVEFFKLSAQFARRYDLTSPQARAIYHERNSAGEQIMRVWRENDIQLRQANFNMIQELRSVKQGLNEVKIELQKNTRVTGSGLADVSKAARQGDVIVLDDKKGRIAARKKQMGL